MERKYGNLETQRLHERSMGGKSPASPFHDKEDKHGETDHENVVAEHGPATEIHITHDHKAGKHSVHSKHESGHEHHAEFGSAKEAHDHAMMMSGAGEEEAAAA